MQEQNELKPAERELEEALRTLAPAAARIDPVAAAFAAGRISGRRGLRLWQSAAVIMLAVGAVGWLARSGQGVVGSGEPIRSTIIIAQDLPTQQFSAHSLLMLQQAVREAGLDGLPAVHVPRVEMLRRGVELKNYRGES